MQISRRIQTGLYVDCDDRCAYINGPDRPRSRRLSEALCSVLEVAVRAWHRDLSVGERASANHREGRRRSSFEGPAWKIWQRHRHKHCLLRQSLQSRRYNLASPEDFPRGEPHGNCAVYTLQLIRTSGNKEETSASSDYDQSAIKVIRSRRFSQQPFVAFNWVTAELWSAACKHGSLATNPLRSYC